MKKICSLLLVAVLLVCQFTCIAYASTDELIDMIYNDLNTKVGEYGTTQTIPNITYEDNCINLIVDPAPAVKVWFDSIASWKTQYPAATFNVRYNIDFKFDDFDWYSEAIQANPNISIHPFKLNFDITSAETTTLTLVDLTQPPAERGQWDVLSQVIEIDEAGNAHIDFEKHTLYIKIIPVFSLLNEKEGWSLSHNDVLECSFHMGHVNLESSLIAPNVAHAIFNIPEETMIVQMDRNAQIESLLSLGYNIEADIIFYINEQEAVRFTTPITQDQQTIGFSSNSYPNDIKDEDTFIISVKYRVVDTQQESPENRMVPDVQREKNPDIHNHGGQATITDERCALCKTCPVQPLNICLFVWIGWVVAIAGIVVSIVLITKNRKESKHE